MLSKMSNVPMSRIISFLFTLFVCLVPGRWCFTFGLVLRYTRRLPQLKYFSIFFMFPMQNTTTLSPSFICVEPFMSCPFPSRTSPPKVMLGGSPRSLTCLRVTFASFATTNSATSAFDTVRHFTLVTSAFNIIWYMWLAVIVCLLIIVPMSRLSAIGT